MKYFLYALFAYFSINLNLSANITNNEIVLYKLIDRVELQDFKIGDNVLKDAFFKEKDFINIKQSNGKLSIPYTIKTLVFKISTNEKTKDFLFIDAISTGKLILLDDNLNIINSFGFKDSQNESFFSIFKIETNKTYFVLRNSNIRYDDNIKFLTKEQVSYFHNFNFITIYLFIGASIFLILYHIGNFIITKNKSFLFYIIFNSCYVIIICGSALFFNYYIRDSFFAENLMFFSGITGFFISIFARNFLNLDEFLNQKQIKIIKIFEFVLLLFIIPYNFVPINLKIILNYLLDLSIISFISNLIYHAFKIRKKNVIANFYLLSWLFLFLGIFVIYSYEYIGLFKDFFITRYALLIGCSIEMIINSFGLAYKNKMVEIEKNNAELEAKEYKRYSNFVKILCHDIANPLTAIKMNVQMLSKFDKNENTKDIWRDTSSAVNKINEILETTRDNEVALIKHGFVDIKAVNYFLNEHYEKQLNEKNIKLIIDGEQSVLIPMEKTLLINNVLGNLLSNAIKFSKENSYITLKVENLEKHVNLSIIDQGAGISKEQLDAMNKGILVSTKGTKNENGTGFGTQIVKELLKQHDVKMEYLSDFNKGTEVRLQFKKQEIS